MGSSATSLGKSVPPASRVLELDALRGLAALGVLVCHLPRGFWFGQTGVDLFFVLSGYLITTIIIQNRHQQRFLSTFYARRSLRIWPIYYLAIGAVVAVNLVRRHPEPMGGLMYFLVYLQYTWKYWHGVAPVCKLPLAHTWTLAIEEQFYLIWPALILFIRRRYLQPLALMLVLVPILTRAAGVSGKVLLGHCDGLALGAVLSTFNLDGTGAAGRRKAWLFAGVWLLPLAAYMLLWWHLTGQGDTSEEALRSNPAIALISLAYFGMIGLVVVNAGGRQLRWLRTPALCYLGQISYGLYLYHAIVYEWLDTWLKFGMGYGDPWWLDLLKVATSLAVAVISWHFLEQPILKLKDRFAYQAAKHAVGTSKME